MGRHTEKNLQYFSFDTDINSDPKIEFLEAKFGIEGFAVFVKLLVKIYGDEGYFLFWDEDSEILMSAKIRINVNIIRDIVTECLKRGLFNSEIYEKYHVLTSKSIQERYLFGMDRRKKTEFFAQYLLINPVEFCQENHIYTTIIINDNINQDLCKHLSKLNPENLTFMQQTKQNKTKQKVITMEVDSAEPTSMDTQKPDSEISPEKKPELKNPDPQPQPKPEKPKPEKLFPEDSQPYRIAEALQNSILSWDMSFKKPNLQAWAKEADLMLRVDKRDYGLALQIILWLPHAPMNGTFTWRENILSVGKLRKQFDAIKFLPMKLGYNNSGRHPPPSKQKPEQIYRECETRKIWCPGCKAVVDCRFYDGSFDCMEHNHPIKNDEIFETPPPQSVNHENREDACHGD